MNDSPVRNQNLKGFEFLVHGLISLYPLRTEKNWMIERLKVLLLGTLMNLRVGLSGFRLRKSLSLLPGQILVVTAY